MKQRTVSPIAWRYDNVTETAEKKGKGDWPVSSSSIVGYDTISTGNWISVR
jgi:hypothetical protein